MGDSCVAKGHNPFFGGPNHLPSIAANARPMRIKGLTVPPNGNVGNGAFWQTGVKLCVPNRPGTIRQSVMCGLSSDSSSVGKQTVRTV